MRLSKKQISILVGKVDYKLGKDLYCGEFTPVEILWLVDTRKYEPANAEGYWNARYKRKRGISGNRWFCFRVTSKTKLLDLSQLDEG